MKKISAVIFTAFLLSGCATLQSPPINVATPQTGQKKQEQRSFNTVKIINALEAGWKTEEIPKPNLTLPKNVNENQIMKYFSLGDLKFALVLRPSMNIPLIEIPKTFSPTFAGILIAEQNDSSWSQLVEIRDNNANKSSKNNPYYLWTGNNNLFLSVIDQNGAGSGEGIMKLFTVSSKKNWQLDSCYYFNGNNQIPPGDYDYFSFSSRLSDQKSEAFENCKNDVNLIIPINAG